MPIVATMTFSPLILSKLIISAQIFNVVWGQNEVSSESSSDETPLGMSLEVDKRVVHGWSEWAMWSSCSRTCDNGVSYRLRRCLGKKCRGEFVQYQLCNTEPCKDGVDFRYAQCAEFNGQSFKDFGFIFSDIWEPEENPSEPCALSCKARRNGVIHKFRDKVVDGTKCRNDSFDVCINGECLATGCDNVIGSKLQYDECGVCAGDGKTCNKPTFAWRESEKFSDCDKTCGEDGWRVSVSTCWDTRTERLAPEKFCADSTRPRPQIQKCPYKPCPAEWLLGRWQDCNVTCGGGWQVREVYCAERYNSSLGKLENKKIPEKYCWQEKKPEGGRKCNSQICPIWEVGEWTQCSTTCGKGYQFREVACRQDRYNDLAANACNPKNKPLAKRICDTGLSCKLAEENRMMDYSRFRYLAAAPFTQWDAREPEFGTDTGKPHWSPHPWTDCSTTCGPGVKTRKSECVAFQPITQNLLVLPDYECEGSNKPSEFQPCEVKQCPAVHQLHETAEINSKLPGKSGEFVDYKWDYGQWESCSASCLGGTQRITLKCIEVDNQSPVAWRHCDPKQRPAILTRPCNSHPCPPKWDIGSWSVCSHSCGGGAKTRKVRCVKEINQSGAPANVLILPDIQCPNPKPKDQMVCNYIDCPVHWNEGPWGQCSTTCDSGNQKKLVTCEQLMANGEVKKYYPESPCKSLQKPPNFQICNLGPCPTAAADLQTTLKNFEQQQNHSKLTLRVGGKARLYEDTSVKIKCPVKNFDRSQIIWMKDGQPLQQDRRIRFSKNGALRILKGTMKDSGNYTCLAGEARGHIALQFKSRLPDRMSNRLDFDDLKPVKTLKQKGMKSTGMKVVQMTPVDTLDKAEGPDAAAQLQKLTQSNSNFDDFSMATTTVKSKTVELSDVSREFPAPSEVQRLPDSNAEALRQLNNPQDFGPNQSRTADRIPGKSVLQQLESYLRNRNQTDMLVSLTNIADPSQVRFEWRSGEWTPCSQTCGDVEGMQVRAVQCKAEIAGTASYVDDFICIDAGIVKPSEAKYCNKSPCPKWVSGSWSECTKSRCVKADTAIQSREVYCIFPNGSQVNETFCTRTSRPRVRKECVSDQCKAVWRATDWQPCTTTCGNGIQMRTLNCVWNGTRKPAGNSCRGADRPSIIRQCELDPCSPTEGTGAPTPGMWKGMTGSCEDQSKFCPVVRTLRQCSQADYPQRCCFTCRLERSGQTPPDPH